MLPYLAGYSYCTRTQIVSRTVHVSNMLVLRYCAPHVSSIQYLTYSMSARSTKHSVQLDNLNKNRNTSRSSFGDGFGTSGLSWENSAEQWISVSAIDKSSMPEAFQTFVPIQPLGLHPIQVRVLPEFRSHFRHPPSLIYQVQAQCILFSHPPCPGPSITSDYPPANPQSRKGKTEDTTA
ncbi:hypothetical protein V8C44DRAFT_229109 [Trichoderma aethiopicum]